VPIAPSWLPHLHLHTSTHTSCISRDSGWRVHCGVEVTESSTNKQHTNSLCRRLQARARAARRQRAGDSEVHYDTCKEVAELGYTVQDSYCCGVPRQVTAMHKALENQLLSIVLAEFTASHSCCLTSENTGPPSSCSSPKPRVASGARWPACCTSLLHSRHTRRGHLQQHQSHPRRRR